MSDDVYCLYDETENTRTRYVSFVGNTNRFDLAITITDRFYGKFLILNLQSNRYAIIGEDDLQEPRYIESVYHISSEEADELTQFFYTLL
jgi:hypothetical protein